MKTAVSIPDQLFRQADAFARRTKRSRSQLYAEALAEFLARRQPDAVTEAMDRALDGMAPVPDAFGQVAAAQLLRDVEW